MTMVRRGIQIALLTLIGFLAVTSAWLAAASADILKVELSPAAASVSWAAGDQVEQPVVPGVVPTRLLLLSTRSDQDPAPISGFGVAAEGLPALRQAYMGQVAGLADRAAAMRAAGSSSEDIARALHAERRALGVEYKSITPQDELARIYARNQEKYGDPLGPSIDYLISRGKSWEDVIGSAQRTGGGDLGY